LSDTYVGKTQDKKICDAEPLKYAPNTILYQDKDFQGHAPAGVLVQQPQKKPRGRALPAEEQIRNSLISRVRIVIENIIASIKRCRIVKALVSREIKMLKVNYWAIFHTNPVAISNTPGLGLTTVAKATGTTPYG